MAIALATLQIPFYDHHEDDGIDPHLSWGGPIDISIGRLDSKSHAGGGPLSTSSSRSLLIPETPIWIHLL